MTLVNVSLEDEGEYKVEVNFKNDTLNLEDSVLLYTYGKSHSSFKPVQSWYGGKNFNY